MLNITENMNILNLNESVSLRGATRVTNMPLEDATFPGATRVNNMPSEDATSRGAIRVNNMQMILSSAVSNTSTNPNYSSTRYGSHRVADVELSFRIETMVKRTVVDADGFSADVMEPIITMKKIRFCAAQIECFKNRDMPRHEFAGCHARHFNPHQFGGQRLCGFALSGVPCAFGTRCNMLHTINFPQIVEQVVVCPTAGGFVRQQRQRPDGKLLLCYKKLAQDLHIALPEGTPSCTNCKYAHSIEDQAVTPQSIEFKKRYADGTLDIQKMVYEIYRVLTSVSLETQKEILSINKATQYPGEAQCFLDMWFSFWSKAASIMRKTDASALALFDGASCIEENLVWELCRLLNICWTSKKQLTQVYGGRENIVLPVVRDNTQPYVHVNHREVKDIVQSNLNSIEKKRSEMISSLQDFKLSKSERDEIQNNLTKINTERTKARHAVTSTNEVQMCQGGATCKHGVHVELVDEKTGLLFAIDSDDFIGRGGHRNRQDIVSIRKNLITEIELLRAEQTTLKNAQSTSVAQSTQNQKRLSEIKNELDFNRNELVSAYNMVKLFNGSTTIAFQKKQQTVAKEYVFDKDAFLAGLHPSEPTSPEHIKMLERIEIVRKIRTKFISRMTARINKGMKIYIRNFRIQNLTKHQDIVNASPVAAKELFTQLLANRSFKVYDEKVSKPRTKTSDGRPIFYIEDNKCFIVDIHGNYRECQKGTALMTNDMQNQINKFDLSKFKEFVVSGAYTAMPFTYYLNSLYSVAWSHFQNSNVPSWNIFIEKVTQMNQRWNELGVEFVKTVSNEKWDEENKFTIEEVHVWSPEKEKFEDFWAYFFNIPKNADTNVVGTAGVIAQENPELFKQFLDLNITKTFSQWLESIPKYNATLLAMKQSSMAGYSFSTVCFFVNCVQPVSPDMSIKTCAENMAIMRMWISSNASKNIPVQGVEFAIFTTMPYQYLEFYQHGFSGAVAFARFIDDKKQGWQFMKVNKTIVEQQVSMAYMKLATFTYISNASVDRIWKKTDMLVGDVPMPITINADGSSIIVTPSIHDIEIIRLATLVRNPKGNEAEIVAILESLPTSEQSAIAMRDAVCNEFKQYVEEKLAFLQNTLITSFSKLNRRNSPTPESLSNLKNVINAKDKNAEYSMVDDIRSSCKKVNKSITDDIKSNLDDWVRLVHLDVDYIIQQVIQNTTTAVYATPDAVASLITEAHLALDEMDKHTDSVTNILQQVLKKTKAAVPSLIATARLAILSMGEKTFAPIKETKQSSKKPSEKVSKKGSKSVGSPPLPEEFEDDNFSHTTRQKNPLLLAGRYSVPNGKVLYFKDHKFVSGDDKKRVDMTWVIGPFENKKTAMSIAKSLAHTANRGGVTVKPYDENGFTVYEVRMPNASNNIIKNAKKYDIDDSDKNSAIDVSNMETSKFVSVVAKAYGYKIEQIFAPELSQYIVQNTPVRRTTVIDYETDSDNDSSDSDDERFVPGTMPRGMRDASNSPSWMMEEMDSSPTKEMRNRNKGRK